MRYFGNLTDRLIQGFLLADFKGESFWARFRKVMCGLRAGEAAVL